jgi:hypothetical protein
MGTVPGCSLSNSIFLGKEKAKEHGEHSLDFGSGLLE